MIVTQPGIAGGNDSIRRPTPLHIQLMESWVTRRVKITKARLDGGVVAQTGGG